MDYTLYIIRPIMIMIIYSLFTEQKFSIKNNLALIL